MTRTARPAPTVTALTVAEYHALGDQDHLRDWELQEGSVVVSPGAAPHHMRASAELYVQLSRQQPGTALAFLEVDVDLGLVAPDRPGTVRKPDLMVTGTAAYDRVRADGGVFRAAETLLVVEILSPSSHRLDRLVKRDEYADAGIACYWLIDLDARPSLIEHRLDLDGHYRVAAPVTGIFTTDTPFAITMDLDAIV